MSHDYIIDANTPPQSAYGRIIRERGTMRLVIAAIVLAIGWYIYTVVQNQILLNHANWPTLKPDVAGLTVLGFGDPKNKNIPHKYEARQSNHAWQIRYREDSGGESEDDTPESKDRGNTSPAASHDTNQGSVVPTEKLFAKCPVVMTGKQFTGADIEEKQDPFFTKPYYIVHLSLSGEGQSRYWHFSKDHDEERLAFILQGEVIACPRIAHMNTSALDIEPIWIKSDAQRLADFINRQK